MNFFSPYFLAVMQGMRDLVPQPGIQPAHLAVEAQSLNHDCQGSSWDYYY